ncbi:GNAT family N-acetyltransferase [Rhodanobacter sp. FW106-PBR-LB-2-11]|uniref:GNAT family N-acetyltransferase n=1 Tax=Rhodanobacter sp. FW106-PBR-LB-2-11 TaxID=1524463 RepID=UPI0034E4288B
MPTIPIPSSPEHARRPAPEPARLPATSAGVRVRRADTTDLDALVAMEQRSFSSDLLSRTQYRRHLDSDSALVLVASDGHQHVLGAAVLFFRKGSGVARLYSLATLLEARGRGIAAALLEAAVAAARRRGCRALRLEVRTGNAAAIGLYERRGFRRTGHQPGYYEDGEDAWRYEKPLD